MAIIQQKPVLYGRALRRGSLSRVFLVRPGSDPCKACLGEYARASRVGECAPAGWIDVSESDDDVLAHECGRPIIPASAADLSFAAAIISRVAIDFLEGKNLDGNHWLWSWAPAPDVDRRFDKSMVTHVANLPRCSDCWACREPEIAQVVMTEEVQKSIVAMTEISPNSETGGVLIGTIDDQRRVVMLQATGPGPEAKRSKGGFARDVEYVQAELDRLTRELGAQTAYVGEWHSHLESDPQPSTRDIDSLSGIAAAPNYLTRCPVLLIAGLDTTTQHVAAMKTWAFLLGGRMYPIPNTISSIT